MMHLPHESRTEQFHQDLICNPKSHPDKMQLSMPAPTWSTRFLIHAHLEHLEPTGAQPRREARVKIFCVVVKKASVQNTKEAQCPRNTVPMCK
jgi:hypothetical protein